MLVQGAGVATAGGVLDAPTAAITDAVNIKVGGLLRLVRAADARLAKGSRIVAIGGHYGFEPSAYAATAGVANAALSNVVRQLSWAYGPRGVTAHLVAPGPADTERLRRVATARGAQDGLDANAVLAQMRSESAIGAFTTVEQIAWAIGLLLDPHADALAGSTLFMDAGRRKGVP
jgi:NAD(P)-dependent dehydrogenase (short-subunit alcohol dehydrogenase family)